MPDRATLARRGPAAVGTPWCALELTGRSAAIHRVHELVRQACTSDGGMLLVAEQGADVESIAREVHQRSRGESAPFVTVDCKREDVDALLFGPGTTGAPADLEEIRSDCRLAAARGGTVFLQDVGELPASLQARLARVVRDGEASLDGQAVPITCRLIASATPGIDTDADSRHFRADLLRRLSTCRVDLPSLRDRTEDVPALAARILEDVCKTRFGRRSFTHAALALLSALSWPGNLAELRGVIERAATGESGEIVQVEHLLRELQLDRASAPFVPAGNLREARLRFEREYIAAVLQHHGWRLADAARTLGIQRPNLYRKARQLGIVLTRTTD